MERQHRGWPPTLRLRSGQAANIIAAAIFIVLAILFTWPLAPNLHRAVSDPGDPLVNIWILDWDWWATLHQPLSLFHANAFHPARYSLAYSENLYGIALLLFPLRAAGVGPIAAYNVAMLAGFAFCGFAAYLLGRHLTGSFAAGLAAGVFYAFVPFRFVHLAHVQHVLGGWLPLLLLALLAFVRRPSWSRGILFAVVFVMNGLANIHYLLFGGLAIAITGLLVYPAPCCRAECPAGADGTPAPRTWNRLLIPFAFALLILVPFLYPYLAVAKLYDMARSFEEVWRFSAWPSDWLPGATEPERQLFPGALAMIVSVLAFVVARREKAKLALALLWMVIGFAGSLGLHFVFHEFLFGAVPGFRAIRAPARWAVIAYVGMAILIALFTAAVARRQRWLAYLVPLAFAVSLWPGPVRWYLLDPRPPAVHRWLADQDVKAIAEMPPDGYELMLHATTHHKPMVNSVSGFAPPPTAELVRMADETPISDAFVDALRDAGVELVIVHADRYGTRGAEVRAWLRRELERGRLRFVRRFDAKVGADWVFALDGRAPIPRDLEIFLAGGVTCTTSTALLLEFPPPEHTFHGQARFTGWAASTHGIASVDLWLDNRRVRHRARIAPLPVQQCPGPPSVRFEARFDDRPDGVSTKTDVQVEVTDGRGRKTVSEDRWIRWE